MYNSINISNLRQLSLLVSQTAPVTQGVVYARADWQVYTYIFAAARARRPPTVLCKHKARAERVCVCTGPAIYLHIHTHSSQTYKYHHSDKTTGQKKRPSVRSLAKNRAWICWFNNKITSPTHDAHKCRSEVVDRVDLCIKHALCVLSSGAVE